MADVSCIKPAREPERIIPRWAFKVVMEIILESVLIALDFHHFPLLMKIICQKL